MPVAARDKALILSAIYEKHGKLSAALVVEEADPRNEAGVAHQLAELLEWNDQRAANRYREGQARAIIRSCEPELIELGVITVEAPHYVRDPSAPPGEQGYAPLLSLTADTDAAELMDREIDRAESALRRAYGIAVGLHRDDDAAQLFAALAALGRQPSGAPPSNTAATATT